MRNYIIILNVIVILCVSLFGRTFTVSAQETRRERIKERLKERWVQRIEEKRGNKPVASDDNSSVFSNQAGDYKLSFRTQDNRERTYILHVPEMNGHADYDPDKEMPLVIVLHGTFGTGARMQKGLGFDAYADDYGFLVAYPDAYTEPGKRSTTRWNDGRGTLPSSELDVDDVSFIKEMIDDIDSKTSVEREKVFVTGASNGGIMTYRLGCEAPELFAGIAPVIGNIAEPLFTRCSPQTQVSLLAINGTDDPHIPIEGGEVCKNTSERFCEGGYVVSRKDSVEKFMSINGCSLNPVSDYLPVTVKDGTKVEKLTYNCSKGIGVVSFIVHGGGHTWPPRKGMGRGVGTGTKNMDATKEIVEFFLKK